MITDFVNEDSGRLAIEAMIGDGHFHNMGTIETDTALAIGVKQFTTQGHLKAKLTRGLDTLISFTNLEAGKVDVLEALGFALETWIRRASDEHGLSFAKLYGESERRALLAELADRFKVNCPWPLELLISGNDFTNAFIQSFCAIP